MMHFGVFAVMDTFHHFRTNEGTARDDSVDRDHFAEVLGAEGSWVDVVVAEGTFEADVKDEVVVDVRVLRHS